MTTDERLDRLTERHEALTMNLELTSREIQDLKAAMQIDAENIRALARIAERRHERLNRLEGGDE
jgi:hypothetical protein